MEKIQEYKFGVCSTCGRGLDDMSEFVVDSSPVKCVLLCNECWDEYLNYCDKINKAAVVGDCERDLDLFRENAILKTRIQELEAQLAKISDNSPKVKLSSAELQYLQKQKQIIESSSEPFDENEERIVKRDGKKYRQWCSIGMCGNMWYGEKEIPDNV